MHKKFLNLLGLLVLLGAGACSDDTELPPAGERLGLSYYPIAVGENRIYEVEQIDIVPATGEDTSYFQLREEVSERFINQTGDTVYVLRRFSRPNGNSDWKLDSTWSARPNLQQVVVTENNIPYIKLVFPVREGLEWDGNALNARDADLYRIISLGGSFSTTDTLFKDVIEVEQENLQDTIVLTDVRREVYANGVGLVYRETVRLEYCATPDCLGQGIVEEGLIYRQKLVGYEN